MGQGCSKENNMNIIYRISPFKPDNPAIYYPDDKYKMVKMCHKSFIMATGGWKMYPATYLLDSCDWNKDFEKYGKVVNIDCKNKNTSLLTAYDIAASKDDDILFVEDDYLWRPDTIPLFANVLKELKVMSPYDHPAHYIEERFKGYDFAPQIIGGNVYRKCPSNTHTFGVTKEVLKENIDMFKNYGVQDHALFTELNKTHQMWCPTYSFATHLATGCTAPNVNWIDYT